ncbi:MAG: hypothetical protein JXB26_14390 [Candidatus Aminicenantes bacterium]|nr:hypothetical protein [Candidatus Aminicenantes bacterium]
MKYVNKFSCVLMIILTAYFYGQNPCLAQENDEDAVRAVFLKFQKGIEQGNVDTGPQLTTKLFSSAFIPFYNRLAEVYSKAKITFPVEINHLKILEDGRVKVETRITYGKNLFVFTLKKEGGVWKFCHFENILFPIYSIPPTPYEDTYEIPHKKRGFMMAELNLARKCYTYETIKKMSNEKKAGDFFLDGPGYKVAMDTWLPFIEGAAQFALFFAIQENNFYGADYIVTKADYDQAEVICRPLIELDVLKRSSHYPKFTNEQYIKLFKAIMDQRAQYCDCEVDIIFDDINCTINIHRKSEIVDIFRHKKKVN